jgi:hypothetical protein
MRCSNCTYPRGITASLARPIFVALLSISTTTGAQVISNPAPDPAAPTFRIAAQAEITLGGQNDRDPSGDVWQVFDAAILSTGTLVVSHQGGKRIELFNATGRVVGTLGREGQGPGEYFRVDQLFIMPGDTIVLSDRLRGRMLYFTADARFVRQTTGARQAECCLRDGAFLTRIGSTFANATPDKWQTQIPTWSWQLVSGREPQAGGRVLIEMSGDDPSIFLRFAEQRRINATTTQPGLLVDVPYRRRAIVRAAGEVVVAGRGDNFEYRVYSRSGTLLRTVRAGGSGETLTPREIADARRGLTDRGDAEERKMLEVAFQGIAWPATAPSYDRIAAQPDGDLWLRGYRSEYLPAATTPHWWARFDASGKLLGTLQLPSDVNALRFLNDRVILGKVNAAGFTTLSVHRIERQP